LAGYGRIVESVHATILKRHPRVRIVALAETDQARRDAGKARLGSVETVTDYRKLMVASDIDAVVICLPTGIHAEAARAALESEKHVYLEKPLAASFDDAERLRPDCWPTGRTLMMGFNYRFHPLFLAVKERLAGQALGRLVGARSVFSTAARQLPAWKQRRESGGGALLDLASHHIDLTRFLFEEEIVGVSAQIDSRRYEEDTAWLTLRTGGGLSVQSLFSLSTVDEDCFEIIGEAGTILVNRHGGLCLSYRPAETDFSLLGRPRALLRHLKEVLTGPVLWHKLVSPWQEKSYAAALDHFVRSALEGRQARPDWEDGYCSLAVVDAAERSAREGRTIRLQLERR
jgi:myo-inositol 2-dehydrogenase/D-chiro-inositol 1-dehydrogenase